MWRVAPDAHRSAIEDVRAACDAIGRDPGTLARSIGLYGVVGRTEEDARRTFARARDAFPGDAMRDETWESWRADTLSGSIEQVQERAGEFAALDVAELVVSPWTLPFTVMEPEQVDLFAEALLER